MDWNTGAHSSLVSIGTHSLHAAVSGPTRKPDEPLVIIMQGLTSSMSEWPVAHRLLSQHIRVFAYDRTGYGKSEPGPAAPDAETIAQELNALLEATGLAPPYITVGHSWGGVLTMEFLASRTAGEVVGMVFVDAGVPHYFKALPFCSDEAWDAVCQGIIFREVTGTHKNTALSDAEWDAFVAEEESEKHGKQAALEEKICRSTYAILESKNLLGQDPPVLGTAPVAVLRGYTNKDLEKAYEAGVAKGNGTPQQRMDYRAMLDGWVEKDILAQTGFFKLTAGKIRFMEATEKSGHNIQMTEPELIVDAVRWVIEKLPQSQR